MVLKLEHATALAIAGGADEATRFDQRVTIGAAIHEISIRTGVNINQVKLLNDRVHVNFMDDIFELITGIATPSMGFLVTCNSKGVLSAQLNLLTSGQGSMLD